MLSVTVEGMDGFHDLLEQSRAYFRECVQRNAQAIGDHQRLGNARQFESEGAYRSERWAEPNERWRATKRRFGMEDRTLRASSRGRFGFTSQSSPDHVETVEALAMEIGIGGPTIVTEWTANDGTDAVLKYKHNPAVIYRAHQRTGRPVIAPTKGEADDLAVIIADGHTEAVHGS